MRGYAALAVVVAVAIAVLAGVVVLLGVVSPAFERRPTGVKHEGAGSINQGGLPSRDAQPVSALGRNGDLSGAGGVRVSPTEAGNSPMSDDAAQEHGSSGLSTTPDNDQAPDARHENLEHASRVIFDPTFPLVDAVIEVRERNGEEYEITTVLPVGGDGTIDLSEYTYVPERSPYGVLRSSNYVLEDLVLGPDGLVADVVLERGATINVSLVAMPGARVDGLTVAIGIYARTSCGGGPSLRTDTEGRGSVVVRALDPERWYGVQVAEQAFRSEVVRLDVHEVGVEFDVTLHVEPVLLGTIAAVLTDDRGVPIADSDVVVRRLTEPLSTGFPVETFFARTDERGYFAGTVEVDAPRYFRVTAQSYEPAEFEAEVGDLVPITLRRLAFIAISLRDAQSGAMEPLAGGSTLTFVSQRPVPGFMFARRDGEYGLPAGQHRLAVAATRPRGTGVFPTVFDIELEPGDYRGVTVDLLPGQVEGVVLDDAGQPLAAAAVFLSAREPLPEWCSSPSRATCRVVTDESGNFRIQSVPEGLYRLTVNQAESESYTTNLTLDANGISGLQIQLARAE